MDEEAELGKYGSLHDAELDAAFLQSNGIAARVDGGGGAGGGTSMIAGMTGAPLNALVAVRVWVPKPRLSKARRLLAELRKADKARPTFRVPSDRRWLFAAVTGALGVVGARFVVSDPSAAFMAGAVGFFAGAFLGWFGGKQFRSYNCSSSDCGTTLKQDDKACPKCLRRVVGEIHHADDRLEAEERWESEQRRKTPYRKARKSDEELDET